MDITSKKTTDIRRPDGNIVRIEAHNTLRSTSELAKEYASLGYGDRYVVFSEYQTTSRITGTRLTDGAAEHGIFLSVLLRPSMFPSQVGNLSPIATASLLTALDEYTGCELECGWLSDIYCDGKRIGGVLVEGKLDSFNSYEYIIVSFAIRLDPKCFPPRLTDMVRKVFESESNSIAMIMAKSILKKFFISYASFKNPTKSIDIFRKRCILVGKIIRYNEGAKKYKCRVLGVDSACKLIIEDREKSVKIISDAKLVNIPTRFKIKKKKT